MTTSTDPVLNKSHAAATLTPPARQLHQWVLTSFVDTGHAPRRADLDYTIQACGIDPGPAIAELLDRDLLAVDEQGEIRAAYPFSPIPTAHFVSWTGGPTTYAMCAVDALGMSAMLDRPVTIAATEPGTSTVITIQVDHDHAIWHPVTAVVLAGTTNDACCPSADRTCRHINVFTTTDAAHTWAAAHPGLTTALLDQNQALACGIAEFGALLHP